MFNLNFKMMKRGFLLRILTSFAIALLVTNGLFAQVEATGDYEEYDASTTAPTTIDYVTVGATMGYYAVPDPVYHPSYVLGGPYTLTADFTWAWTVPTDPGTAATVTYPVATFPANYARITYPVAGNYVVNVAETAPAAFGGCADVTPTIMNVTVIAAPTGTMSIAPGGAWQEIAANASYQICGDQAAQTVTVSFVENIPNALASYAFQITETIQNLDGAGTVTNTQQAATVIENWALTSKLRAANLNGNGDATTLPGAAFATATPNFTFTFNTDALDVLQNAGTDERTRYTYTVTRTGDTGNNDFVSNISHKSGYIDGVTYYAFTNNSVSFIVNPAPSTGTIYYIPNDYAY